MSKVTVPAEVSTAIVRSDRCVAIGEIPKDLEWDVHVECAMTPSGIGNHGLRHCVDELDIIFRLQDMSKSEYARCRFNDGLDNQRTFNTIRVMLSLWITFKYVTPGYCTREIFSASALNISCSIDTTLIYAGGKNRLSSLHQRSTVE
jgi:hypothetical protein